MSGPLPVFINARFLTGGTTAVNNVARELLLALNALQQQDPAVAERYRFWAAVPPAAAAQARELGLACRVTGRRSGILWEQFELPRLRREGLIAGFFNTAPLIGRGHVTMLHDAHVFEAPGSYRLPVRLWRQLLSRRAAARGRLVLTVSEYSKRRLAELGVARPGQIHVVSNGTGHLAALAPAPDILHRHGLAGPYFVALSSLLEHKNIGVLLQAFARPELAAARLVLVGKSTRGDFLSAGHSVPGNVLFPGFVSDAELAALYGGAVAVLSPSRTEGFGLPPAEALTLGTPAVAAPCGALPEVCGPGALYADPASPAEWAAAAQRLLQQPGLRTELAARGRRHVAGFTWENAARAVVAALDSHCR